MENPQSLSYEEIIELGRKKGIKELRTRIVLSLPILQTDEQKDYRESLIKDCDFLLKASPTKDKKHICCDGECNHDDCCGKIPENCPLAPSPKE